MRHEKNVEEKEAFLRELFRVNPDALQAEAARALKHKFKRGLRKERVYEIRREVRLQLQGGTPPTKRPEAAAGAPILIPVSPAERAVLERVVSVLADQGLAPVRIDHQGEGYVVLKCEAAPPARAEAPVHREEPPLEAASTH